MTSNKKTVFMFAAAEEKTSKSLFAFVSSETPPKGRLSRVQTLLQLPLARLLGWEQPQNTEMTRKQKHPCWLVLKARQPLLPLPVLRHSAVLVRTGTASILVEESRVPLAPPWPSCRPSSAPTSCRRSCRPGLAPSSPASGLPSRASR